MSKFHTGLIYHEYQKHLKKINFKTNYSSCYVKENHVLDRLKQKYISVTLNIYGKTFGNFFRLNASIPDADIFVNLSAITLKSDGQISLSKTLILKSFAEFFFEWTIFFTNILTNRFVRKKIKSKSVSIFFGVGIESILNNNSDQRFISYINSYDIHKIDPLGQFESLVVQSNQNINSAAQNIFYNRYPQAYIFKAYPFSWHQYFRILGLHFLSLFDFFRMILVNPELILISRDFSCLRVYDYISKLGLIKDVMYTNSNYMSQPLWMRFENLKTHKIHYAQNYRQLVYKDYQREDVNPCLYEIYADTAWVWTEDFKLFANKVYDCADIRVVGPIMFYLPDEILLVSRYSKNEYNISLFDITPINDDYASDIGLLDNYYSGDNLKKFLSDIVTVVNDVEKNINIKINIYLKHKRGFNKNHVGSYIDLCKTFEFESKISIMLHSENIFNFILSTDLSIAIPYTSTAHICAFYNRHSLYYDPTGEILLQPNFNDKVLLVDNKSELYNIIRKKVLEKFNKD